MDEKKIFNMLFTGKQIHKMLEQCISDEQVLRIDLRRDIYGKSQSVAEIRKAADKIAASELREQDQKTVKNLIIPDKADPIEVKECGDRLLRVIVYEPRFNKEKSE